MYCSPQELPVVQQSIQALNPPSRVRLLLYIHTSTNDCINKMVETEMKCVQQVVYPINRLRNLAINNILTTHFLLFDMDMWPNSIVQSDCLVESTYQTLLNLPDSYLQNPYFVTIIPAFSLTSKLLKHHKCNGFKECVLRAIPLLPETKPELQKCIKRKRCSPFRPLAETHVFLILEINWIGISV